MDVLNRYFLPIKEFFAGMTPSGRATSALLLIVAVVSLGYVFTREFGAGDGVYLLDNRLFSSDELTPMLAAFSTEGLSDFEIVGGRIRVARGKQAAYVAALAKNSALPRDFSEILDGALENSSPFEGRPKFEARLKNDKQKFLAEVFRQIKGIERAAVLFDEEIKPGLRKERVVTASVSIKPAGMQPLDEMLVNAVCQTMVGAVAGLRPENVVVMDLNTGRSHIGSPAGGATGGGGLLAQEQRKQEENWRRKIEDLLSYVPGVIVTPSVDLAPERVHRTRTTAFDKEKSIPASHLENKATGSQHGQARGGRPGHVANAAGNTARSLAASESNGATEAEKVRESSETAVPSGEETEKEFAPHTVERVAVAIAVPTSYFAKVWRNQHPPAPGEEPREPAAADIAQIRQEETAKIKQLVAGVLPQAEGQADPSQLVQVSDFQHIAPAPLPEPGAAETVATWLGIHGSSLGLLVLGLAALAVLRSAIRAIPPGETIDGSEPAAAAAPDGEKGAGEAGEERPLRRFSGTDKSLREDLSALVASDPETAASILRNWIGTPTE
ncbi:MAG: hypothetical protein GXY25_20420 [Pirellulaceae bacterium]|jgi:flagellar biosynthesis/type III secretory pathway M-ring protein FliF/YscJ|nr:hypothetical protein [Thermoguttaceae bacterium]MDI9443640.1 hypothetical protein [Planctomycetota bacterium]NLZ02892.1 hypothetical protein [Pirellulaceae bacterium]